MLPAAAPQPPVPQVPVVAVLPCPPTLGLVLMTSAVLPAAWHGIQQTSAAPCETAGVPAAIPGAGTPTGTSTQE